MVPEVVTQKSDKSKCSTESKSRNRYVTSKSLNSGSLAAISNSNSRDGFPKRQPISVSQGNYKDAAKTEPIKDNNGTTVPKKSQKSKTEPTKEDETMKKSEENSPPETGNNTNLIPCISLNLKPLIFI